MSASFKEGYISFFFYKILFLLILCKHTCIFITSCSCMLLILFIELQTEDLSDNKHYLSLCNQFVLNIYVYILQLCLPYNVHETFLTVISAYATVFFLYFFLIFFCKYYFLDYPLFLYFVQYQTTNLSFVISHSMASHFCNRVVLGLPGYH